MRATAEEDRRGDGAATGGVPLGPEPAAMATEEASPSFECTFFSTSLASLVELVAVEHSDSLTLGSRFTDFLLADFFLAGDLEWHRTHSHLPRGTFNQNMFYRLKFNAFNTFNHSDGYLGEWRLEAFDVVSFGTLVTEDADGLITRFATDDAIALACSFVPAFVTEPITVWDVIHWRPEAVRVIAFITTIAQQELVLFIAAVAKLATGFHDGFIPRH